MPKATELDQPNVTTTERTRQESAEDLKEILDAVSSVEQIELSEDEIAGIVNQLSRVMPASDIPGVIRSGMARLRERHIFGDAVDRDIDWLTGWLKPVLDKATYLGVFAVPIVPEGSLDLQKMMGASCSKISLPKTAGRMIFTWIRLIEWLPG